MGTSKMRLSYNELMDRRSFLPMNIVGDVEIWCRGALRVAVDGKADQTNARQQKRVPCRSLTAEESAACDAAVKMIADDMISRGAVRAK